MVWIHGGGNSVGHGAVYRGDKLAEKYGVVVVTFNYRLGPLGWFDHRHFNRSNIKTGNYALLDQIALLEWVWENINGFGGDPENVTLFGESAGGLNIFALLTSPLAKGLFHKAIIQSGLATSTTQQVAREYSQSGGHEYL